MLSQFAAFSKTPPFLTGWLLGEIARLHSARYRWHSAFRSALNVLFTTQSLFLRASEVLEGRSLTAIDSWLRSAELKKAAPDARLLMQESAFDDSQPRTRF
jgi:hypothetical protein